VAPSMTEHDLQEVANRFPKPQSRETTYRPEERSARGIQHLLNGGVQVSDYNTNTFGSVTFRRIEETPKMEKLVADGDLQSRLESLCATLRSRY
jgi:hypothetical protein